MLVIWVFDNEIFVVDGIIKLILGELDFVIFEYVKEVVIKSI